MYTTNIYKSFSKNVFFYMSSRLSKTRSVRTSYALDGLFLLNLYIYYYCTMLSTNAVQPYGNFKELPKKFQFAGKKVFLDLISQDCMQVLQRNVSHLVMINLNPFLEILCMDFFSGINIKFLKALINFFFQVHFGSLKLEKIQIVLKQSFYMIYQICISPER